MPRKSADYLCIIIFLLVIATVFQQIATSMTEQGIASGGPYDNAASYPRSLAIIIGFLLVAYVVSIFFASNSGPDEPLEQETVAPDLTAHDVALQAAKQSSESIPDNTQSAQISTVRGIGLLVVFAFYLLLLPQLGYQLSTPIMLGAVLLLAGSRRVLSIVVFSIAVSLGISFVFEVFLNVVLPGGVFSMNIPWPSF